MTVTQGPRACHNPPLGGSFLPTALARPKSLFARPSLALRSSGAMAEPCPECPRMGSGWAGLARGAGEGVSLLPTGRSSRLFCRLYSRALIIPAPGGIVPHYYTADLYLIRHHLKPSGPSWHPCLPRTPHVSACFTTPAGTKLQFRARMKEKLLNSHPAKPGDSGAPRGG